MSWLMVRVSGLGFRFRVSGLGQGGGRQKERETYACAFEGQRLVVCNQNHASCNANQTEKASSNVNALPSCGLQMPGMAFSCRSQAIFSCCKYRKHLPTQHPPGLHAQHSVAVWYLGGGENNHGQSRRFACRTSACQHSFGSPCACTSHRSPSLAAPCVARRRPGCCRLSNDMTGCCRLSNDKQRHDNQDALPSEQSRQIAVLLSIPCGPQRRVSWSTCSPEGSGGRARGLELALEKAHHCSRLRRHVRVPVVALPVNLLEHNLSHTVPPQHVRQI